MRGSIWHFDVWFRPKGFESERLYDAGCFRTRKTNPFFRREASNIKSLEQEDLCLVCGFCKLG